MKVKFGQKRSSSCLVILNSRPMSPTYFCYVSFMIMLRSCIIHAFIFFLEREWLNDREKQTLNIIYVKIVFQNYLNYFVYKFVNKLSN